MNSVGSSMIFDDIKTVILRNEKPHIGRDSYEASQLVALLQDYPCEKQIIWLWVAMALAFLHKFIQKTHWPYHTSMSSFTERQTC